MAVTEAGAALSAASTFAGLDPDVLAHVARIAAKRRFDTGEAVFLEGEPCDGDGHGAVHDVGNGARRGA